MNCPICKSTRIKILPEMDEYGTVYLCENCGNRIHPDNPPIKYVRKDMSEPFFHLLHIGGRQDFIGPAAALLQMMRDNLELTVCEADPSVKDSGVGKDKERYYGAKLKAIPYCIFDKSGTVQFHVNKDPDSSSILKPNPRAARFSRDNMIWGEMTKPDHVISLQVVSIDELVERKEIVSPDFLSIDAQGVEYQILRGAKLALENTIVGVVSEVEFQQLYSGQKLFVDQDRVLRSHGFILQELYNMERWYPDFEWKEGSGAVTVAEALWLKDYRPLIRNFAKSREALLKLSKLGIAASAFDRDSYKYLILKETEKVTGGRR